MKRPVPISIVLPLLLAAAPALASPVADLAAIDREVAAFSAGAAMPVDRRLRLAPCAAPLQLGWHGLRRDSVRVQCPDPGGWGLFVPVRAGSVAPSLAPGITRGEGVTITLAGEGFALSLPGEALEGGPVDGWIRVRATAGGRGAPERSLRGRIVRPGAVEIPMP